MKNVSSAFLSKIKEPSRNIKAKVNINGVDIFEDNIVEFSIENIIGSGNMPTIGGVTASKLNLKILATAPLPQVYINKPIQPFVALETSTGVYEWVSLGKFYASYDDITKTKQTISFECLDSMAKYDEMEYKSALVYPAQLSDVIAELSSTYGLVFEQNNLSVKNICPSDFDNDWEGGSYSSTTGLKATSTSAIRLKKLLDVTPNTSYYANPFITDTVTYPVRFLVRAYDANGVFLRNKGGVTSGTGFTTGADEYKLGIALYDYSATPIMTYDLLKEAFEESSIKPFICLNTETDKTFAENDNLIWIDEPMEGSVRQVLSLIASRLGKNAVINQDGKVEFRFSKTSGFAFDSNNYFDFKLKSESQIKISQVTSTTNVKDEEFIVGDGTGYNVKFKNPVINRAYKLNNVFSRNYPLYYYAYELKAQGFPHLEVGDIVSFTDVTNVVRTLMVINHKLIYRGGLRSEFVVDAPKGEVTVGSTGGSTVEQAVAQAYRDVLVAINNATRMITGNQGGYVTIVLDENDMPTELVLADQKDLNVAQRVWRWNQSGLGFSSNGYNGTYKVAITADGHINASFIDTGVLTADIIKSGILKSADTKGSSWINMNNGTFSLANGVLVYDGTNFTINFTGTNLETALNSKANSADLANFNLYFKFGTESMTIGRPNAPQQISVDNVSMQFLDDGSKKEIVITSMSATGSTVTANFASQGTPPFLVGSYVLIAGVVPTVYNGTFKVTACTATSVTFSSTATGTVTTQGKVSIGFMPDPKAVAYINGKKMFITDLQATNSLIVGVHQIQKQSSNMTIIKYIG